MMSPQERLHLGWWRTAELRELLEDQDRINLLVRCNHKFQRLQEAAEKMLASNQKLAKISLSQKTKFRDTKLLLSVKYKELEKLRNLIQVKQQQLAEKHSIHYAHLCLLRKISQAEEDSELLFQRFAGGKSSLSDFLDSFLSSRTQHHIRLVVVKKLQEMIKQKQRLSHLDLCSWEGLWDQIRPIYSLTTAVIFPVCCHPPVLLPLDSSQCSQHLQMSGEDSPHAGPHREGFRWPLRPVRLQPLKVQQRKKPQPPQ